MSLRVISGSAKGRKLKSVPGDTTRPVTDRVKEALFNIVAGDVLDSVWWDMFAGTGAVGIESLSRGAAFVRFTDLNRLPIETIETNLTATQLKERAETKRVDSLALLGTRPDKQFHYIYVAPPQYHEMWSKAMILLDDHPDWLAEDGWIIIQIDPKEFLELDLKTFEEIDQRKYGATLLVFYARKAV